MAAAASRIKKELIECKKDQNFEECGLTLELVNDQWNSLKATLKGPPETPFENGTFILSIEIPESYPFLPPKIKFETKIWHPNISSQTGAICLDILKDQWAAAMTLRIALLSIQALLSSPVPDDPQDAVVAKQFKSNHQEYIQTAKYWTEIHASKGSERAKIMQLKEMGFPEFKCIEALRSSNGDVQRAVEHLFASNSA